MNSENVNPALLLKKKENHKNASTKTSSSFGVRNPLGDICANAVSQNLISSRTTSRKTTVVTTKRPKSESSAPETKVEYNFKSKKTTERENQDEKVSSVDEVFVSGVDHYLNCFSSTNCPKLVATSSEVKKNAIQPVPAIRIHSTGEKDEIKKPPQKVNLLRKLSKRNKHLTEEDLYKNCLYNEEYFEDNYRYMLGLEDNFVYRREVLKKYINENYRAAVVGWLHYACQVLRLNEQTIFMAVRMFDYILALGDISTEKYTLVGLTCLWIINKQSDVHFIQIPNLVLLLNKKFLKTQIISLEKEILQALKFNINFPEPLSFLFYFLKQQDLENNSKIRYGAMFILETSTLLLDFSTMSPSLLASAALLQVLVKYNLEWISFLEYINNHLFTKNVFLRESQELEKSISCILASKKICGEIVKKYSTEETFYVAKNFLPC